VGEWRFRAILRCTLDAGQSAPPPAIAVDCWHSYFLFGGRGVSVQTFPPKQSDFRVFTQPFQIYVMWDHDLLIAQSFPLFVREDSYS
jgi:hypothetical protein